MFEYQLAPAPKTGGFAMDGWWVWCGSAIRGEDGRYHLFASRWPKKYPFYSGYFYYSEIVRAVADNPLGPYRFQEVVLGHRDPAFWDGGHTHNPTIHKIGDRYCLFYTGHTFPDGRPPDADICRKPPYGMETGDCIGVATAPAVSGPWTRLDRPILAPRANAWDRARVTNPADCVAPDGRIRLYYRSDRMQLGVAEADAVEGPYRRLGDGPIAAFTSPNIVEDMYVWHNGRRYEMIAKDCSRGGALTGEERAGVHATSDDGLDWTVSRPAKAYSRTVIWDDGTPAALGCLERAQALIEDGRPRALFFAAGDGPGGFDRATCTWNMAVPLKGRDASAPFNIYTELTPELAAYDAAPLVHIANRAEAEAVRQRVIEYLWPDGNLPTVAYPSATAVHAGSGALPAELDGLDPASIAGVERLETVVDFGYRHASFLLHPVQTVKPARLAIVHQGHQGGLGDGIGDLAARLVREGFTVLIMQMPLFGWNPRPMHVPSMEGSRVVTNHNELFAAWGNRAGSPLRFFIEPVMAGINHFVRRQPGPAGISMIGLSGGGWTTHLAAALDTRIGLSLAVAGSYPLFLRPYYPGSAGDAEQVVPGLYERAGDLDLYILGADAPGRRQIQVLNQYDPCCFHGVGSDTYKAVVSRAAKSLGGHWKLVLDSTHRRHQISSWAIRHDDRTYEDAWGVRHRLGENDWYEEWESGLLQDAETVEDVLEYPFPGPDRICEPANYAQQVQALKDRELFVLGDIPNPYKQAWYLRGVENILADYLINPEILEAIYDKLYALYGDLAVRAAKAGVDMITVTGDIAMQDRIIMGPDNWRRFDKPRLERLLNDCRTVNPDLLFYIHSDGNIMDLMDDIVEIGFNVVNPIQPECMDPVEVKKRWGNRIAMHGGVSLQRTLPNGTPDDVRAEINDLIRKCGYNGGLVVFPSNVIQPDTTTQNIIACFHAARDLDLRSI